MSDANSKGHKFELLTKPVHPVDLLATIKEMTETTA